MATNIQLSDSFQHPFVLIPKPECLVGAGQIGCRESGTASAINLYTMEQSALLTWVSCSYVHEYQFISYSRACLNITYNESYVIRRNEITFIVIVIFIGILRHIYWYDTSEIKEHMMISVSLG